MPAAHKPGPTLTIVAGPNGSGKSSVVAGLSRASNLGVLVNADLVAVAAARRKGEASPSVETQWEAAHAAEDMRWALVSQRISFVTETVMSDVERWSRFIQEAKDSGYRIVVLFVTTEHSAINVARVKERALAGGHAVPPQKIISRYRKVMSEGVALIVNLADEAVFFDNSSPETGALGVLLLRDGDISSLVPIEKLPAWAKRLLAQATRKRF